MPPSDPVLDALLARDTARIQALLDADPGLVRRPLPGGTSPLLMALYLRHAAAADLLLRRGVVPDLHEAAALGDAARVRALLADSPPLARALSPDGTTALHLAAHFGHGGVLQALLAAGADVRQRQRAAYGPGNTALHAAAAGGQHAHFAALLAAGAEVDARDDAGNTPLHVAAATGLAESVRCLLAAGADPALANAQGKTPGDVARERGKAEAAALLPAAAPAGGPPFRS